MEENPQEEEMPLLRPHRNNIQQHGLLANPIVIPAEGRVGFSFRKLWQFTGPGFLMSIAFLDPGNIEADLQAGAATDYKLLWVLLWSTVLGLLMQRLAARVGTVTGYDIAEVAHREYRVLPRTLLWIMMEVAIIGSDMQEVVGTAIAIHILSNRTMPLWGGVLITLADTFTFLFLDKYGLRKLELLFASLITTMALTFGYEFFLSAPDIGGIMKGIFIPLDGKYGKVEILQSIGIIGACIMPHNLYLHSGLVKTRAIDRSQQREVSEANFYYFIESALALFVSFIINAFVISVFASGLYQKTNADVRTLCQNSSSTFPNIFQNNTDPVDVDTYSGGVFLDCKYGNYALYIWAIGILAAGQSSTMCGCYAGQFTMEGLLNLRWARWKRVLFTRSLAIVPTLYVAKYSSIEEFSGLNDFLNTLMCLQLPFAILPAIAFSSNPLIMGEFANGVANKIIAVLGFILIVGINATFVSTYIDSLDNVAYQIYASIFALIYFPVCLFLLVHTAAALTGLDSCMNNSQLLRRYILGPDYPFM